MDPQSILAYFLLFIKNNEIPLALSAERIDGLVVGLQSAIKHETAKAIELLPSWPSDQTQRAILAIAITITAYRHTMGFLLELASQSGQSSDKPYLHVLSKTIQKALEDSYGERASNKPPFDNIVLYLLPGKDMVTTNAETKITTDNPTSPEGAFPEQSPSPGHSSDGFATEGIPGIPAPLDHSVPAHENCRDQSAPLLGQI